MTRTAPGTRALQAEISEELHRRVKAQAALRGMTIREAVTEALTSWCASPLELAALRDPVVMAAVAAAKPEGQTPPA